MSFCTFEIVQNDLKLDFQHSPQFSLLVCFLAEIPNCHSSFGKSRSFYQSKNEGESLFCSSAEPAFDVSSRWPLFKVVFFPSPAGAGFAYDGETNLYYDDTCVVPDRLEGKYYLCQQIMLAPPLAGFCTHIIGETQTRKLLRQSRTAGSEVLL